MCTMHVAWQYGRQPGYIAYHVNIIHKIKTLCEMTLGLQIHLKCGHLLGLNSPNATFPSKFFFTLAMTWTHFSRCGNSLILLSLSHLPFLLLACGGLIATIACKPRLLSSYSPSCLVSFSSSRDLCDECGQSTIPWGINRCKAFKHLPI